MRDEREERSFGELGVLSDEKSPRDEERTLERDAIVIGEMRERRKRDQRVTGAERDQKGERNGKVVRDEIERDEKDERHGER